MANLPPVKSNLLDRIIESIDPVRGLARLKARSMTAVAGQWLAGRTDRRPTKNWNPISGSADADILYDLPKMRDRSRDLTRNNPLALGAINTVVSAAVGTGLVLRSRVNAEVLGMTDDEAQQWQREAECEFRAWAENPSACDAARTLDFYAMQALAFRSALESGDVFALLPMVPRAVSHYEIKVHLIEADRVCNERYARDTDTLAGGVRMDSMGAPVGYDILRQHPGGFSLVQGTWDTIPAFGAKSGRRNVLHLFDKRRPGQTRGFPYLAPVVEAFRQLGNYTDAEITAAIVSGMFTVMVETPEGNGLETEMGVPASTATPGSEMKLGAGAIVDLAPGEKVNFANPSRPNTAFDPFVQAILRQIGAALEIPFELLIKHFTASYSAARASLLEAWRFFKGRRAWLAAMFCQPIYEAFLEEAVASGRIAAPGFFDDPALRMAYCGSEWIGDSPGQIDPLKEVQAARERLDLLLTSRTDETTALTGGDWSDTVGRVAHENALMERLGVKPGPATPAPAAAPANPADANPDQLAPGDQPENN